MIINYVRHEKHALKLVERIKERGKTAIAIKADVSKLKDIGNLFKLTLEDFGKLDIFINNAAIFWKKSFVETNQKELDEILKVNFRGCFSCCQLAARQMIE